MIIQKTIFKIQESSLIRIKKETILIMFFLLVSVVSYGQYTMDDTDEMICSGTFTDSGGSSGNYSNNENFAKTFTSGNGGRLVFNFSSFEVENNGANDCWDTLTIYNGTDVSGDLVGVFCNNFPPPTTITSTGRSLHFVFSSDGSQVRAGWEASISCTAPFVNQCDPVASGNLDTDGDGTSDVCDLDDDNDGVLDADEFCSNPVVTNLVANNAGSRTVTVNHTNTSYVVFDLDILDNSFQMNINGAPIYSSVIEFQGNDVQAGEVLFVFQSDNSTITSPWVANNNNLPRLKLIIDELGNVSLLGTRTTGSTILEPMIAQAGASFNVIPWVVGNNNTFEIIVQNGDGNEALDGSFYAKEFCDTDNDSLFNHLDTDSDNDGCPDALEADGGVLSTQLSTLVGGSVGAGSSLLNLGAVSNNNGIPLPFGTAGGIETAGQNSTVAMLDASSHIACTTDLSLTKTVDSALPKVGADITYTFTLRNDGVLDATGIVVADLMPIGLTFKSKTSADYNEGNNKWSVATLLPGAEVSVSVTVEVATSGKIINKAQITENNTVGLKEDVDSVPNNDK